MRRSFLARRRNSRRPLDRSAGQGTLRTARAGVSTHERRIYSLQRDDAHVRRESGWPRIRKGAADAIATYLESREALPAEVRAAVEGLRDRAARRWSSPRMAAPGCHPPERYRQRRHAGRFYQLRAMGIRTVMITGDNPLTAAAIAPRPASTIFLPRPRRKTKSI